MLSLPSSFTNEEGIVSNVEARSPFGLSDHVVLSFQLQCYLETDSESLSEKYMYNKGNYDALRDDLNSVKWEE